MPPSNRSSALLTPVTPVDLVAVAAAGTAEGMTEVRRQEALLKTGIFQNAILNSANFSIIATDEKGIIQLFNIGAERMLGYLATDVLNKITPADISDPQEVIARAKALSLELSTPITPGFEALAYKASRGIEDIYELTYIRKDGSRFGAVVSVTALRDAQDAIIGYLLIGTDNTARKLAEEALRENYALLRTIQLHSLVSVTDQAGVILDANDGFCKISGYRRDELLGQTHRIVNSGVQARAFWTGMWDSIKAGQPWRGEICNRAKDGSLYWVDSIISPFMGEDGHTNRFISVRTDITARKRAEEALLKAGALQSAIFNSANFSSIATDAKGVIQIFNVGAERMLGYTAADVMNKITPADISDPQEVIARAEALSLELGTPITPGFEALVFKASRGIEDIYELTYFRKDGSRFPAVVSVTALRDAQDAIIGYLLIGTDNTARKQADNKLRTASQYARSLIEASLDPLVTISPEGKITDVNAGSVKVTGVPREKLIGTDFSNYFTEPEKAREGYQQVFAKGSVTDYPLTIRHEDGRLTDVLYNASVYKDLHGNVLGVFAAARDVTDQKQASQYARSLIEASLDPLVTISPEGKITDVNAGSVKVTGVPREKLIGTDFSNYFTEPEKAREGYREAFSKGSVTDYPLTIRHEDGRLTDVLYNASVYKDVQGNVLGVFAAARDITARKQAEAALLKAGALQSAIFNSANFSSIATDAKGVIQIFNVGAERMLGYTATEVMNKITPADISDPQEVIVRAEALTLELGTPITPGFEALVFKASRGIEDIYELTYFRKDGSRFPAVVSVTALRDAQDAIIGYLLIGTDNTARKKAEEALLEAGALQSAIFNSANFSSIATDAKGVIQIFNVGAERMLGYTAAEVMNKITPADISDPQEVIARAKALSQELATEIKPGFEALVFKASRGIEDIYELTYFRKDGSRFPAIVSVTALRAAHGGIIGYLLIGTDNTARKQVEADQQKLDQRLRDQQFYTRSLIESNVDALMTTDPSGIITDVNKQMEALTDCTRDELIGAPFKNYFTDPERAEAGIKRVLSEKKITDYELTVRARDGKKTEVSYNATTFYDRDRTLQGVFAAARDVTERKGLDQALQETNIELQRAKIVAEKANLAKSEFLSSMSHELRSPLNAILGFAQLMNSEEPPATTSQKSSIDQILHAGWYLLELINEILDLAVIESGKLSLSEEPVSLAEVMSDCRAMMEPQGHMRGITITFPPFDMPYFVRADRTRLKQVLINLLSNAIKYNQPGGTVVVDCVATTPERTRISVRDTGAGLSAEKLTQLFQPFNRLGQESGIEEGTGIGLVMSKRLVELMGGVIGVASDVGVGSEFWFELDSAVSPQLTMVGVKAKATTRAKIRQNSQMRTMLYVEDNPANMKLVEQLIARRPDMCLLSAANGSLGIELARDYQPNVILMDINLPGISGIQALKILQEDPQTAHIPVLAISANAMPGDIKKGLEAGFFRYLTKPIKVDEFMDALDVALDFAAKNADGGK